MFKVPEGTTTENAVLRLWGLLAPEVLLPLKDVPVDPGQPYQPLGSK